MKRYAIKSGVGYAGGIRIDVICASQELCDGIKAFIERQQLPYVVQIDYHYMNRTVRLWLDLLKEKQDMEEMEALIHGYFSGARVIPRHFSRASTFLPQDPVTRPRASWHQDSDNFVEMVHDEHTLSLSETGIGDDHVAETE